MFLGLLKTLLLTVSVGLSSFDNQINNFSNNENTILTADLVYEPNEFYIDSDDNIHIGEYYYYNNSALQSSLHNIGDNDWILINNAFSIEMIIQDDRYFSSRVSQAIYEPSRNRIQFYLSDKMSDNVASNYLEINTNGEPYPFEIHYRTTNQYIGSYSVGMLSFPYYDDTNNYSGDTYWDFYDVLLSYLPYQYITVPVANVNNNRFINFRDLLVSKNDFYNYKLSLNSGGINTAMGYEYSSSSGAFTDESTIAIDFSGDLNGIFYASDGNNFDFGNFTDDFIFRTQFGSIYNEVLNAFSNDLVVDSDIIVQTFYFNNQFNYNAQYGLNTDSVFITESDLGSSDLSVWKNIDLPYFYSNGSLYNRIRILYMSGYATEHKTTDDTYKVCSSEGVGYFAQMFYVNTLTDASKFVCARNFGNYTDSSGNIQTFLDFGVYWVNSAYQRLDFITELSQSQSDSIARFNNNSDFNGISNNGNFLGYSFELINTAFTGLSGFLNIQILPGISLGLLVLTPFMITLLLFVLKLFKR